MNTPFILLIHVFAHVVPSALDAILTVPCKIMPDEVSTSTTSFIPFLFHNQTSLKSFLYSLSSFFHLLLLQSSLCPNHYNKTSLKKIINNLQLLNLVDILLSSSNLTSQ